MKSKIKLVVGLIALLAVIGFSTALVSCQDNSGNSGGSGGTFTLTEIPARYNGMYAVLNGLSDSGNAYTGCQNYNLNTERATYCRISNRSVSFPMWVIDTSFRRWYGSDTLSVVTVSIVSASTGPLDADPEGVWMSLNPVRFSNGSASKTWGDGMGF